MLNRLSFLLAFVLMLGLGACGNGDDDDMADDSMAETDDMADDGMADDDMADDGMADDGMTGEMTTITLRPVGNEMKYETTEFSVPAGEQVKIIFQNVATSPAMQHNVVVLNSMEEEAVNRVGQAALAAGEAAGYIPTDEAIIAYTPMSKPGETVEVTFTAPSEPGDYKYLCTFPGHYILMQGTMHVTPASAM